MRMRSRLIIALTTAFCLLGTVAQAQVCDPESITPTSVDERFLDNRDGTVLDVYTGLVWKACTYGQVYKEGKCTGTPKPVSWQDALSSALAENKGFGGKYRWRVPSTKELESLVERSCLDPVINTSMFPGTPSAVYLTSTPGITPGYPRIIDFRTGIEVVPTVTSQRFVRFVKDAGELQTDLY